MKATQRLRALFALLLVISMVAQPVAVAVDAMPEESLSFTQVDDSEVTASLVEQQEHPEERQEPEYADTDMVRVSILVEGNSVIDQGYSTRSIGRNGRAMAYHQQMLEEQATVQNAIEHTIGQRLDVEWNLALITNLISANVEYGQIEQIKQVEGVLAVEIEPYYYPQVVSVDDDMQSNMLFSSDMTGVKTVWKSGYTGAGTRIAILDTGLDDDHQSFSAEAYEYALWQNADAAGLKYDDYVSGLDLLDQAEISTMLEKLNASKRNGNSAEKLYLNSKVPYAFNYALGSYDATHDHDSAGNHGSHVAGIAAANRYIEKDGAMVDALKQVMVTGNAPDAQILVMDVFSDSGASFSDILAGFEDAILLGADTINLSLGSASPGFSGGGMGMEDVLEKLKNTDSVATISAGNNYEWAHFSKPEALYATDVNTFTGGAPGSATNALTIASVQNAGKITAGSLQVDGQIVEYSENFSYSENPMNIPLISLDTVGYGTEYEYIFFEHYGYAESFKGYEYLVANKIVLVSRGDNSFADKANNAMAAGAKAVIIYNNVSGLINMDLTDFRYEAPCVSISQSDAKKFIDAAESKETGPDGETYYIGKVTISQENTAVDGPEGYEMSEFSSWGVTGDLALKPELTAPGGNIYSVDGGTEETDRYTTMSGTSMAAPQVAGIGALVREHIENNRYHASFANSNRGLMQSLMMSTAIPMTDSEGNYYPVIQQGAGLVDAFAATTADSYIKMSKDATVSYDDGKVKAELGDDPDRSGSYSFSFELYNLADAEKTFDLSADVFAQDTYEDAAKREAKNTIDTLYMDKKTRDLKPKSVDFLVNGSSADQVTVAAGGKATIRVTITLSEADRTYLDDHFEFGTYVQAYVFAKEQTSKEGATGISHSIPMLAFYGNWTDPSMFYGTSSRDGEFYTSYSNQATTDNSRWNYFEWFHELTGEITLPYNYIELTDANSTYILGGNPLIKDEIYRPERNAIKSGIEQIYGQMWLARSATQVQVKLYNENTTYAFLKQRAEYIGAYKNTVGAGTGRVELRTTLTAQPVEGEEVIFEMRALPEYYDDGKMGEDSTPGTGACATITAVVDNTVPKVEKMNLDTENQMLRITAADDRHVSGIVLYNGSGDKVLAYTGAKDSVEEGKAAEYALDIRSITGTDFLLQVFDYAMNAATFRVEIAYGALRISGAMLAFNQVDSNWVMLEKNVESLKAMTEKNGTMVYNAATAVDDVIYAVSEEGGLYTIRTEDLNHGVFVRQLPCHVTDLAYNRADGLIYGVTDKNQLVSIEPLTGACSTEGYLPLVTNTLACDGNGTFYSNRYGSGEIYAFTLDTVWKNEAHTYDFDGDGSVTVLDSQHLLDYVVGAVQQIDHAEQADFDGDEDIDTYDAYLMWNALGAAPTLVATAKGIESTYLQAMEIDPNNGKLFWTSYFTGNRSDEQVGFSILYEIDPSNGEIQRHYDYWDQLTGLVILDSNASGRFPPINGIESVHLSSGYTTMAVGEETVVQAGVAPWNTTDRGLIWSSSDESVAAVDAQGRIMALAEGSCVITVTSSVDPNVNAVCTVVIGDDTTEKMHNHTATADIGAVAAGLVNNALKENYLMAQKETVTVDLSLTSDDALTNGLQTVSFDDDLLELLSITGNGMTSYHRNGDTVTVGYLPADVIPARETIVTLTFRVDNDAMDADLIVRELQRNNEHVLFERGKNLTGHVWSDWSLIKPATCGEAGMEKRTCTHCTEEETRSIPATGEHTWSVWQVTEQATENKRGVRARSCGVCGTIETGVVHAVGEAHIWSDWVLTKPATCGEDGEETRFCEHFCGVKTQSRPISATGDHQWGEWTNHEGTNERTRSCEVCNESQTKIIAELPVGTAVDCQFGNLYIDQYYVHNVQISGAEVNAVTQVEAETKEGEYARLHYVVELSSYANDTEKIHLEFSTVEQWVTGIGSALKAEIVDSVRGDADDREYDVDISSGIGSMECYSYWDGGTYATIAIDFIIGEEGKPYTEPYQFYANDGYLTGLAVWDAEVIKESTVVVDEADPGSYDYHSTVISHIWLNPETTTDDAVVSIQLKRGGEIAEVPAGWTSEGGQVQLADGKATVTAVLKSESGMSTLRRYYVFYLNKHYASTSPELLKGNEVTVYAELGVPFTLNLAQYFMDPDGDTLTYSVAVNGGDAVSIGSGVSIYRYIPVTEEQRVLTVTAADHFSESQACTITIIPVNDHVWGEWFVETAATCVKPGQGKRICTACGVTETKELEEAGAHIWGNWLVSKEPVFNEPGKEIRSCTVCGEVEIRTIQRVLFGDGNSDGAVNVADAIFLARYLAHWEVELDLEAADVDGNDTVNVSDLGKLRRYLAGWENIVLGAQ